MPMFAGMAISGLGSLFGGIMGANASGAAAQEYEQALQQAENFLQGQEQEGLQNYSPYLTAGAGATNNLANLLGTPGQGLLTPWTQTFTPLTGAQVAKTPGYQFQLGQGESAIQNSTSAKGGLLSGRTLADLNNFAQGTANQAYQQYGVEDPYLQYQSTYQTFRNNQNDEYSRLMGLSNEGLSAAGGAGSLISGIGGDIASLMGEKGAAAAQGTIGQANALGSILPGIGGSMNQMALLRMLNGNSPMFTGSGGGFGGQGIPGIGGMGPQMYGGTGGEYSDVGPYAPIG